LNANIKGDVVWDTETKSQAIEASRRFITAYDTIYEISAFYGTNAAGNYFPFPAQVKVIFDRDSNNANSDSTGALNDYKRANPAEWNRMMSCMEGMFKVGKVDHRQDLKCTIPNYILLAASIILVSVIGFKFFAALQCYSFKEPEDHDKFAICQIPCYTEGEVSLTASIKSLATMDYDDKHKLIFVICDGMIVGSGNDRPTPRIVLDILGVDPNYDPEPLAYHAIGDGNQQLNYAKIYSGLYEIDGHTVPYIVVVKVGKPSERVKPGNR
jgi:chitin synthase